MSKYPGEHLAAALCRGVGINPNSVYRVIIDLKVGEAARVITHGYAETTDGKIDRMQRVLRRYELKEIKRRGKSNEGPSSGHRREASEYRPS